ncbi:hypothetical protein NLJ89_g7504 [Agrocybe chaxingu]|uniref:Uncharacterized protein n=1 Tax=Agrocybe chaxingu TaxID=84603 RepID=A0A9W8K4C5_9AGAR|nr:hypothetical protein NLJ89_g7504 [Agrocybe chaxingu]
MISKKLPHKPPRADIRKFHKDTTLYGDVSLAPPVEVGASDTKSWKSEKTGRVEKPMDKEGVERLKGAMKPHAGWKKPPTPPPPSPKQSKNGNRPLLTLTLTLAGAGAASKCTPSLVPSRSPRQSRPPHRGGPYPNQRQRQDNHNHRGRSPGATRRAEAEREESESWAKPRREAESDTAPGRAFAPAP